MDFSLLSEKDLDGFLDIGKELQFEPGLTKTQQAQVLFDYIVKVNPSTQLTDPVIDLYVGSLLSVGNKCTEHQIMSMSDDNLANFNKAVGYDSIILDRERFFRILNNSGMIIDVEHILSEYGVVQKMCEMLPFEDLNNFRIANHIDEIPCEFKVKSGVGRAKKFKKLNKNTYEAVNRLLLKVADSDCYGCVQSILSMGVNPNVKDNNGNTPLLLFINNEKRSRRKSKTLEKLLDEGADPNISNNDGIYPLMAAIRRDKIVTASILLKAGADPNVEDEDGEPVVFDVIEKGNLNLLKLFVKKGLDLTTKREGWGMLHTALDFEQHDIAKYLYGIGLSVTDANVNGSTALKIAAATGNKDFIETALNDRAFEINSEYGRSLFYWAVAGSADPNLELIKFLFDLGFDTDYKYRGKTALESSVASCSYEAVKFLLDIGENVNATGNEGRTVLMGIGDHHHNLEDLSRIVRMLIEKGANIDAKDNYGKTALMHSAYRYSGMIEKMKGLLENGANVDITDNEGDTALLIAVRNVYENPYGQRFVKTLIDNGANPNIINNNGDTAFSIAKRREDIIKILNSE